MKNLRPMISGGRKRNKVMVFGVFDKIHPGHLFFLRKARGYGNELIVAVSRDSAVLEMKGKKPDQSEKIRRAAVMKTGCATRTVLGDRVMGSHAQLKRIRPEIVVLGYDQNLFGRHLKKEMSERKIRKIKIVKIRAFRPKKYHTSILRTGGGWRPE